MDAGDLFALGERLARPCLYLAEAVPGETIIGLWASKAMSRAVRGQREPWLSVSCDRLRTHGFPIEGCLSVYAASAAEPRWITISDPDAPLPFDMGGVALAGREGLALPHLDTIEAYTGTRIDTMAASGRIQGTQVAAYDKHWWDSTFHAGWATLGGWRMPWPDDDLDDDPLSREFYEGERTLVLRTSHNAEPWVEVWVDGNGKLETIPRIT